MTVMKYSRCVHSSIIGDCHDKEYELSIKCLDLTNLLEKTELKLNENIEIKNQYNREKLKLFNRSKELSLRLNELANENRELKGDS